MPTSRPGRASRPRSIAICTSSPTPRSSIVAKGERSTIPVAT
jgi:hypothetical protein